MLTDGSALTRTYTVPAGWTADGPGAGAVGTLLLDALGVQPGVTADATEFTEAGFGSPFRFPRNGCRCHA